MIPICSPIIKYEPIISHKKKKENEFVLSTFKSNTGGKGTANSKWSREILHENRLWINKKSAEKLGLGNGDKVRVISSAGELTIRLFTTNLIHPESLAVAEGFGHTAIGNVARSKKFKSNDRDTSLIWWIRKGSGVNPNVIIENNKDPLGGGQGLKDTVVRLEKV